eukprot:5381124-Pleurochrysis_carterae.AAC.1
MPDTEPAARYFSFADVSAAQIAALGSVSASGIKRNRAVTARFWSQINGVRKCPACYDLIVQKARCNPSANGKRRISNNQLPSGPASTQYIQ